MKKAHIVWFNKESTGVRVLYLENAVPEKDVKSLLHFNGEISYLQRLHMDKAHIIAIDHDCYDCRDAFDIHLKQDYEVCLNGHYGNLNEYADSIRNGNWYGIDYVYYIDPSIGSWKCFDIDEFANSFTISVTKRFKVIASVEVNALSEDDASLTVLNLLREGDKAGVLCGVSEKDRNLSASVKKVEVRGVAKKRG